jgi:hypothetical protein
VPPWPPPARGAYSDSLAARSGSRSTRERPGNRQRTGPEETCPDEIAATAALARLLKQAEGHQAPSRNVLFGQVLDQYLEVTDLDELTLTIFAWREANAAALEPDAGAQAAIGPQPEAGL